MKKVILFGAGASYGAGGILPERPPLGFQLFGELARAYPGSWGNLPPEIRRLFEKDFEQGMELLWDKHSHIVADLTQHMAIYFAQFRASRNGATLYHHFAREIKRRKAAKDLLISTLNYECVLEFALSDEGLPINYFDPTSSNQEICVWKLHGSCNFLPEGMSAGRGVSFTRGVVFDTGIRAVPDMNEVIAYCLGDNAIPPVMCLYMKDKPLQVAETPVRQIQQRWREQVASAEIVALVGVNPNPGDVHLWEALAQTQARLVYIGNQKSFEEWREENRKRKPAKFLASKFDEGFEDLIAGLE